jgi:hypothetical protein
MVAIVTPVSVAAPGPAEAAALGYPATLFGLTPAEADYWREPGLPWFTDALRQNPPLGYDNFPTIPFASWLEGNDMAPRFPKGCAVQSVPVFEKQRLVIGRVYLYSFQVPETGEWRWNIGRLVKIGGNCLHVKADNNPVPAIWLLREKESEAVWDVREVTYYESYPEL